MLQPPWPPQSRQRRSSIRALATIAIALAAAILAWGIRAQLDAGEQIVTKVEYVDRVLTVRDTINATRPDVKTIFLPQTDTVNICEGDTVFAVPADMEIGGVVSTQPVRIDGRGVTLSVWQPYGLRWVQFKYRVRASRFAFWLDAGSSISPNGYLVDARANARMGRLYGYAGYGIGSESQMGLAAGLRYRLFGHNY